MPENGIFVIEERQCSTQQRGPIVRALRLYHEGVNGHAG